MAEVCECDDERPILTQKRLNSLSFPTLQTLTGTLILTNVERFTEENGTISRLKVLPAKLRHNLLKQLESKILKYKKDHLEGYVNYENKAYFEKVFAAFKALVSGECRDICLDWLLISCPTPDQKNYATLALEVLASEAPKLQNLEIFTDQLDAFRRGKFVARGLRVFSENFTERLLNLSTLTSLTLGQIALLPEDLVLISQHLTKLIALKCYLVSTQVNELKVAVSKMMENLKNLKHFDFDLDCASFKIGTRELLTAYCVENFPQLLTVGYNGTIRLGVGQKQLAIAPNSELSELTVFTLDEQLLQKSHCLMLHKITKLNMIQQHYGLSERGPISDDRFLNFSHLRELSFVFSLEIEELRRFLQKYGRNLTKLTLRNQDEHWLSDFLLSKSVPPLMELRSLCPNLQELYIYDSQDVADLPPTFSGGQEPFMSLTTLHLGKSSPYSLGSILLAAPNIQKVTFEEVNVDVAQIQHLSDLIRTKQICKQLTCVEVLINFIPTLSTEPFVKPWRELTKNLCAFAPNLKQVTFRAPSRFGLARTESPQDPAHLASRDCCLEKCISILDNFLFKY